MSESTHRRHRKHRFRLVDSPRQVTREESIQSPPQGEEGIIEHTESVPQKKVHRQTSMKSLTVISDSDTDDDAGHVPPVPTVTPVDTKPGEISSGDNIDPSELYDTRTHPDSGASEQSDAKAARTPIADKFSASVAETPYYNAVTRGTTARSPGKITFILRFFL